ncbi:hypothetical protein DICPUDRAFT_78317 [Dictyostelium purpureum]|uniref:DUF4286 family protein n=1 Tax=Dictyostelium purpureum TaxID=5786 RepID=F0ZJ72_DICPU|nr:uncharacterized protein DICPUDRAFT_78317 [Dictyostelium purpureum]EGC36010.1 hypothetical protein DICPUDRAFT_78317 [Dictyostelium purpureum]|eukprot:XP_003287448.1 hypothetical protein DICPUDRAFT_78317 [Dictyostelium purpureum]
MTEQYIYEVTVDVDVTILDAWKTWIVDHVNHIVNLEKGNLFSKSNIFEVNTGLLDPTTCTKGRPISFVIQYWATSANSIPTYIQKYSDELRKDGLEKFGDKMKASRRVLVEKKSIHNPPQTSTFGYVF